MGQEGGIERLKGEGKLDQLRGRIRSIWGDLTDDDIKRSQGDVERLIGIIKEKTGESAETIREKLRGLMGNR
jgi:uncharacterized protein YjbJ (UPF0337 family)